MNPLYKLRLSIITSRAKYNNAFSLATLGEDISQRIVLAKEVTDKEIIFYTNYGSRKAKDIESCPKVSGLFYFESGSQYRITGFCTKMSKQESDAYFNSRPLLSRIGAIVSKQSREMKSRHRLFIEMFRTLIGGDYSRPEGWGGYRLHVESIEIFKMIPFRLHDRKLYEFKNNKWTVKTLYP